MRSARLFLSIFILLIVFYALLHPKTLYRVFPSIAQIKIKKIIDNAKDNGKLNIRALYEIIDLTNNTSKICHPRYNNCEFKDVFWKRQSNMGASIDRLINDNFTIKNLEKREGEIIYQDKKTLILQSNSKIQIFFLGSIEDMEQIIGLFDYKEKDKKLLENKKWLHESKFNLNF